MTAEEIEAIRQKLGWTQAVMAQRLACKRCVGLQEAMTLNITHLSEASPNAACSSTAFEEMVLGAVAAIGSP